MSHKIKILHFIALLVFFSHMASAQQLDTLKNWRIHKFVDRNASLVPEDSLSNVPSRLLPQYFKKELGQLEPIITDGPAFVQTIYLLSYEDNNGKMVKVIACGVGNFIFINKFQKYWKIPERNRESWLEIISNELQQIP